MLNKYKDLRDRYKILTLFLLGLVVISSINLVLALRNDQIQRELLLIQTHNRQLVQARSGAQTVKLFLKDLEIQLLTLSQVPDVVLLDEQKTRERFENLIDQAEDTPFIGIGSLDKDGKAKIITNRERMSVGEGTNFSEREYFKWAKDPLNKGKIYITSPFISQAGISKDKNVLALITPVYYNDEFNGIIIFAVLLNDFSDKFIEPLRIYQAGQSVLIQQDGLVIAGDGKLLNKNIFNYVQNINKNIFSEDEGAINWVFQYPEDGAKEQIVTFKRINIDHQSWTLFIINNKDIINSYLEPLVEKYPVSANSNSSLLVIIFGTLFTGFFFILIAHRSHSQGFKSGMQRERVNKAFKQSS